MAAHPRHAEQQGHPRAAGASPCPVSPHQSGGRTHRWTGTRGSEPGARLQKVGSGCGYRGHSGSTRWGTKGAAFYRTESWGWKGARIASGCRLLHLSGSGEIAREEVRGRAEGARGQVPGQLLQQAQQAFHFRLQVLHGLLHRLLHDV